MVTNNVDSGLNDVSFQNDVNSIPLATPTDTYTSTHDYITGRSWGFYDTRNNVLCEQIEDNVYAYNANGKLGIVTPYPAKDNNKISEIVIEGEGGRKFLYAMPKKRWTCKDYYSVPDYNKVKNFMNNPITREVNDILLDVETVLLAVFDFAHANDIQLWKLFIVQSWIKPVLNVFFFAGIDATKGGGKTTLLEIISLLCRHGFLGGDVSAASLPRLVEHLDLSLFLDEIDQRIGNGEENSTAILRKGQRRGNPYVRLDKIGRTFEPVKYDVAGTHAYSFRGEVEDAFTSRSIRFHTAVSKDHRVSIINVYKEDLFRPLAEELFFWSLVNIPRIGRELQKVRGYVGSVGTVGRDLVNKTPEELRDELYQQITVDFDEVELDLLQNLTGRNTELAYVLLRLAKVADLDALNTIRHSIKSKADDEKYNTGYIKDLLSEMLEEAYNELRGQDEKNWRLKSGMNEGCFYVAKNHYYGKLSLELRRRGLNSVSTKKFTSMLRDLGFVEGVNMCNQRIPGQKTPRICLVFDDDIVERLGLFADRSSSDKNIINSIIRDLADDSVDKLVPESAVIEAAEKQGVKNVKPLIRDILLESREIYEHKPGIFGVST